MRNLSPVLEPPLMISLSINFTPYPLCSSLRAQLNIMWSPSFYVSCFLTSLPYYSWFCCAAQSLQLYIPIYASSPSAVSNLLLNPFTEFLILMTTVCIFKYSVFFLLKTCLLLLVYCFFTYFILYIQYHILT